MTRFEVAPIDALILGFLSLCFISLLQLRL